MSAAFSEGFNLLPWRRTARLRARRRRIAEWLGAAVLGGVCAAALAGSQLWRRADLDAERAALAQTLAGMSAALAEHARLAERARLSGEQAAAAVEQARPLTHLLALLAALGQAGSAVAVRQIEHGVAHTSIAAQTPDEAALAAWLAYLRAIDGARDVAVSAFRREPSATALQLTVRVNWTPSAEQRGAR